jgi:hypothetical protein
MSFCSIKWPQAKSIVMILVALKVGAKHELLFYTPASARHNLADEV